MMINERGYLKTVGSLPYFFVLLIRLKIWPVISSFGPAQKPSRRMRDALSHARSAPVHAELTWPGGLAGRDRQAVD